MSALPESESDKNAHSKLHYLVFCKKAIQKLFEHLFRARSFLLLHVKLFPKCVLEFVFIHVNRPKIFMSQKGRNFSIKVKSIVLSSYSFI